MASVGVPRAHRRGNARKASSIHGIRPAASQQSQRFARRIDLFGQKLRQSSWREGRVARIGVCSPSSISRWIGPDCPMGSGAKVHSASCQQSNGGTIRMMETGMSGGGRACIQGGNAAVAPLFSPTSSFDRSLALVLLNKWNERERLRRLNGSGSGANQIHSHRNFACFTHSTRPQL